MEKIPASPCFTVRFPGGESVRCTALVVMVNVGTGGVFRIAVKMTVQSAVIFPMK
jgi:hypothetical protein